VVRGAVGRAGDLRRVRGMDRRLRDAARQGFNIALIPPGSDARSDPRSDTPPGMRALTAPTIVAALEHMIDIADHRSNAPGGPQRLDA